MPWRDELAVDAVEYSSRPKEDGPAPNGEEIERGKLVEFTAGNGRETFDVELQFWRDRRASLPVQNPTDSAAGYLAWRIGDEHGRFGVFDGHAERVWLGTEPFVRRGTSYAFVDIGTDWRDKIHLNEFIDRIYPAKLQYPAEQAGEIDASAVDSLVDRPGPKTEVYDLPTREFGDEITYRFQLWRRPPSQAVFIAVQRADIEEWQGERGVLGRSSILSDIGTALSLEAESMETVYELTTELRDDGDDIAGLRIVEPE